MRLTHFWWPLSMYHGQNPNEMCISKLEFKNSNSKRPILGKYEHKYTTEKNYISSIINRWSVSGQRHFNIFKLHSIIYFIHESKTSCSLAFDSTFSFDERALAEANGFLSSRFVITRHCLTAIAGNRSMHLLRSGYLSVFRWFHSRFVWKRNFNIFPIKTSFFADVALICSLTIFHVFKLFTKFWQFCKQQQYVSVWNEVIFYVSFSHSASDLSNNSFGTMGCLFWTKVEQVQLNRMYQSW